MYVVRHASSGRSYVGKTKCPKVRWAHHRGSYMSCPPRLRNAIRLYGPDAFVFAVVATLRTEAEAFEAEKMWIRMLRSNEPGVGFNLSRGGRGGAAGVPKSAAHRAKISVAHAGRRKSAAQVETMRRVVQTPEKGRKISEAKRGHVMHPATRAALALANTGRHTPHSAETKAKLSAIRLAMPKSCMCGACRTCKGRAKMRAWRARVGFGR